MWFSLWELRNRPDWPQLWTALLREGGNTMTASMAADGEEQLWTELAERLDDAGGTQIKTYHPRGDQSSATWFANADFISILTLEGALDLLLSAVDMSVT